jgi:hypothetical protein
MAVLDKVKSGTLIIAEGISLPASCEATSEPFTKGWRTVTNAEGSGLDKRFSDMGWTCFQKGAPAKVTVMGLGETETLRKAFRKIIRGNRALQFNCLEVTQAIKKTFMGVTYVHLSACARNIRQRSWIGA